MQPASIGSLYREKIHINMKLLPSCVAEPSEGEKVLITDEHFEKSVSNNQQYYHLRQIALEVPCFALRYSYYFIAWLFSCRFVFKSFCLFSFTSYSIN